MLMGRPSVFRRCCNIYISMPKEAKKTKSFVLRIDSETMDAIERWAADEFRSTNGQLQWIINEALKNTKETNC